jgi:hypothetical protein
MQIPTRSSESHRSELRSKRERAVPELHFGVNSHFWVLDKAWPRARQHHAERVVRAARPGPRLRLGSRPSRSPP